MTREPPPDRWRHLRVREQGEPSFVADSARVLLRAAPLVAVIIVSAAARWHWRIGDDWPTSFLWGPAMILGVCVIAGLWLWVRDVVETRRRHRRPG